MRSACQTVFTRFLDSFTWRALATVTKKAPDVSVRVSDVKCFDAKRTQCVAETQVSEVGVEVRRAGEAYLWGLGPRTPKAIRSPQMLHGVRERLP